MKGKYNYFARITGSRCVCWCKCRDICQGTGAIMCPGYPDIITCTCPADLISCGHTGCSRCSCIGGRYIIYCKIFCICDLVAITVSERMKGKNNDLARITGCRCVSWCKCGGISQCTCTVMCPADSGIITCAGAADSICLCHAGRCCCSCIGCWYGIYSKIFV